MAKQKKRWSTPRKIITWVVSIVVVLAVILGAAGGYFFHVAEVRAKKDFIGSGVLTKKDPLYSRQQEFLALDSQTWHLTAKDGTKLVGNYVPADKKTNKTVVVIHGFGVEHKAMAPVSYTHLRAHETDSYLVCRLLLEKKKNKNCLL